MADGKETAYVPQIILARGLWMVSATMRSWRITALAKQEQIALTAERAMITCAILVEVIIGDHCVEAIRTRLRPLRRRSPRRSHVHLIAVFGLAMGYATRTPVMERSQIVQMEQIAPIAASVT